MLVVLYAVIHEKEKGYVATSQLVTRSSCHTVNSAPVNSSHTRLVTQSTRHITKPPQCRAVRFNYL